MIDQKDNLVDNKVQEAITRLALLQQVQQVMWCTVQRILDIQFADVFTFDALSGALRIVRSIFGLHAIRSFDSPSLGLLRVTLR